MGESFPAMKTLEGLLSRVDSPVDDKVAALLEAFSALWTLVKSTLSERELLARTTLRVKTQFRRFRGVWRFVGGNIFRGGSKVRSSRRNV